MDLSLSNFVDLLLESEGVNRSERQAEKQADPTIKCLERVAEGPADLVEGSRHCGRVRDYAVIDYRELSFLEVLATVPQR